MRGVRVPWPALVLGGAVLVAAGVGAAHLWLPQSSAPASARPVASPPSSAAPASGPLPDVVVTLSDDSVHRAGVKVTPVTVSTTTTGIRLSGVVEPNAYRQVVVTPLVSGRVMQVRVMLGEDVVKGAALVDVYSPELAEAQARFLSMRAAFQAAEQEIARTNRLAEIGAASKQELERIHAEHVRHRTEAESARTRLQLLGMTAQQIEQLTSGGEVAAMTTIASPISGVVTARTANPGATVDPASPLVNIVDLSTVWIAGDLYERDFSAVAVGMLAVVTTTAFPDAKISGKVAYIEPQVRSETRTAKIRIELPNPGQRLRLGMYADVQVESPNATPQLLIPRSAVQNVADRTVVYLKEPNAAGRFIEREVRLGFPSGDQVAVLSGLAARDVVAASGSFFLRAETERLGLRSR